MDNVLARDESTPIHTTAPAMANKLATSKAPIQPISLANQGVAIAAKKPPKFPPVFTNPTAVAAAGEAISIVLAQVGPSGVQQRAAPALKLLTARPPYAGAEANVSTG